MPEPNEGAGGARGDQRWTRKVRKGQERNGSGDRTAAVLVLHVVRTSLTLSL